MVALWKMWFKWIEAAAISVDKWTYYYGCNIWHLDLYICLWIAKPGSKSATFDPDLSNGFGNVQTMSIFMIIIVWQRNGWLAGILRWYHYLWLSLEDHREQLKCTHNSEGQFLCWKSKSVNWIESMDGIASDYTEKGKTSLRCSLDLRLRSS